MGGWMCTEVLEASLAAVPGMGLGQSGSVMAQGAAARGTQGYLGVDIRDVSDEQMSVLKLRETRGAEILRVDHDGPAGKVGLREHDVILQMNGQVVEGEEQLRRMLRETPAGRMVSLMISRDGQQQTLSAKMANREEVERQAWQQHMTVSDPDGVSAPTTTEGPVRGGGGPAPRAGMGFFHGSGPLTSPAPRGFLGTMMRMPYTGAVLEPIGPQLAEFFGVQSGAGLLVRSVEVNSPAATAGLRAGDVVVKVNQAAVGGIGDWSKTVHESKGRPMPLTVLREKKEQVLMLTPDPKRRSGVEWPEFGPGFAGLEVAESLMLAELVPAPTPMWQEALAGSGPELPGGLLSCGGAVRELQAESGDLLN